MNEIRPEQVSQENNNDSEKIHTTKRTKTPWSPFEQVTYLRGQKISRPRIPKSTRRRWTRFDLFEKDARIPDVKFEVIARDLVCSIMERQDRMNEEILSKINDLAHHVEDLEQDRIRDGGGK
jgi:hypothetical protein